MVWLLAKKVIKQNLQSFSLMVIMLIMLFTIGASLFIMYNDYRMRTETYELLKPEPDSPVAIIKPTALSMFVKGLDEDITRPYSIDYKGSIEVEQSDKAVNRLFRLFPIPDMLYVIKVVISLCAMLSAFALVSGEKETATLKLILSKRVSRSSFITGQWIGGFLSFIIPFLVMFFLGVLILTRLPGGYMTNDEWVRLGMFCGITILYLACFFSLGLFASSITFSSASSLVAALMIWCLFVFALPNLGNTLAHKIKPVQSAQQMSLRLSQVWVSEVYKFELARKKGELPKGNKWSVTNSEYDNLRNEFRSELSGLVDLSMNITRLSPSAVYTFLATDIAGTGIAEIRLLKNAVIGYKDRIWNRFSRRGSTLKEPDPFTYNKRSVRDIMASDGLFNITILLLFTILASTAAVVAFFRYDIR